VPILSDLDISSNPIVFQYYKILIAWQCKMPKYRKDPKPDGQNKTQTHKINQKN
jgi:hypothetical protein